ncbi:MAG: cardiolipin synthase [Saccharofermentans sp.]|nr:cardiolipin synthase [Saccharofermentans sp.]
MKARLFRLAGRIITILPAAIVEVLVLYLLITYLKPWATAIEIFFRVIGFLIVMYLFSYRAESTYKLLWVLFVMAMPVAGATAYLFWGNKRTSRFLRRKVEMSEQNMQVTLDIDPVPLNEMGAIDPRMAQSFEYLEQMTGFPPRFNENAEFYPVGEEAFEQMLIDLESAKKFIYLEYFIIQRGKMLDAIVDILVRKAAEGVDVKLIYDDFGSLATFSRQSARELRAKGIDFLAFNQVTTLSGTMNNRTHRKYIVIDGRICYSGGINLSDEYINIDPPYGHWKDFGFKIEGPAVGNYLYMFVTFWNAFRTKKIPDEVFGEVPLAAKANRGVVLSYYDSPFFSEPISNNFYIELLGDAKHYAWFYTPYLILGDNLLDAFVRAAKRGVDVRIIMPGIPDKKIIYTLSRSYYRPLMEAGVKIYEYTPGFVHAKASVIDDEVCTIGSVNLDYRSLFLHFENNSAFWNAPIVREIKEDFLKTQDQCRMVKEEDLRIRLIEGFLRIIAPLC